MEPNNTFKTRAHPVIKQSSRRKKKDEEMLPQCEGGKEDGLDTKVKQNIDLNKAEPGRERIRVEIPKVSF